MAGQGEQVRPTAGIGARSEAVMPSPTPGLPPLVQAGADVREVERRSKENTRQRLVAASIQVFVEQGLAGVTVDDLTSAAGFTRGAFYSNFSSKEEVFEEAFALATDLVIEAIAVQAEAALRHPSRQGTDQASSGADEGSCDPRFPNAQDQRSSLWTVLEGLRPVGLTWYVLQNEAVVRALREPESRAAVNLQRSRIRAVVVGLFENLLQSHPNPAIDIGMLADTLLGVYMNQMVAEQLDQPDTSYAVAIIDTVLNAFLF